MSDFLAGLLERAMQREDRDAGAVQPRPKSRFEPPPGSEPIAGQVEEIVESPAPPRLAPAIETTEVSRRRPLADPGARPGKPPVSGDGLAAPTARMPLRPVRERGAPPIAVPSPVAPQPLAAQPKVATKPDERTPIAPAPAPARLTVPQPGSQRPVTDQQVERRREDGEQRVVREVTQVETRTLMDRLTIQPRMARAGPAPGPLPRRQAVERREAERLAPPEPVIHISIGRIEVRATQAGQRSKTATQPPAATLEPLDDYLRRRKDRP